MGNVTRIALLSLVLSGGALPAFAAPCSADIDFQRLTFSGTTARQILVLTIDATGAVSAQLDCNGDGDFVDAALGDIDGDSYGNEDQIHFALKGNDTITINQTGPWTGAKKDFQFLLATGANNVSYESNGNGISANSRVVFEVQGGGGVDTVDLSFAGNPVDQSSILIRANLGVGNDVMSVALPETSSTGRLNLDVNLGVGTNAFSMTQGPAAISGEVNLDLEGGSGRDSVTLNPTVVTGGRMRFNSLLGGGNDTFVVNLDLSLLELSSDGALFLNADGGSGNDILSVTRNGTTPATTAIREGADLDVRLGGGIGNDALTVDLGGGGIDAFTNGTIRLRADGGAGADIVNMTFDSTEASPSSGPGRYDVAVTGGTGNDVLSATHNALGNVSYLQGAMIVDGGQGVDACTPAGSSAASLHLVNCAP
jgi:hypothetical protein